MNARLFAALRDLASAVEKEQSHETLRELLIEMNKLLDRIEAQIEKSDVSRKIH